MTVIYILDGGGQHIGPFKNRENVERFIKMMALCGENWAGNKIVEGGRDDTPGQNPAPMNSCANQSKRTDKLKLVRRKP
jgi:hypothetical protein